MHNNLSRRDWARHVIEASNGICSSCGTAEDVSASYLVPPSMGGRNTPANGVALCSDCYNARADKMKVRVTLSLEEPLAEALEEKAHRAGRNVSDVLRQLASENIDMLPAPLYPNGKPTTRKTAWLAKEIYENLVGAVGHRARVGGVLASLVKTWTVGSVDQERKDGNS